MKHWLTASIRWWYVFPLLVLGTVIVPNRVGTVWASRSCCFGDQWLSWSPDVREAYVSGFRDGFPRGARMVCYDYFSHKPSSGKGGREKDPIWACEDRVPQFYHVESKFYVDAITGFYKKYPSDRWLFPWEVLLDLADPPGFGIDQIHTQVDKRHHP